MESTTNDTVEVIQKIIAPRLNQMHEVHVKLYEAHGDLEDLGYNDLADLVHTISCMVESETRRLIEFGHLGHKKDV